jgi:hypothetical protein
MNSNLHTLDCKVVFEPSQPDRFYMDLRVYRVLKPAAIQLQNDGDREVWRGIYLAVEMKPWQNTGRRLKAG